MTFLRVFSALVIVVSVNAAHAEFVDGSVYLLPIDSQYSSVGEAKYYNDLQQAIPGVFLSGEHSVLHPGVANVKSISAIGAYSYTLQGSATPGVCYDTTMRVVGELPPNHPRKERTFTGATRCARAGPIEISQLCPLILDLNGDGVHTTGLESPVLFWTFNGVKTYSGWTDPTTQEAFLWINSELDLSIDEAELFGSRMPSPTGALHLNGFQALEKYDTASLGGNGDGRITAADQVWWRLRLWNDRNHDGKADLFEVSLPSMHRIVALNLARVHNYSSPYANGNGLMLVGSYVRRTGFNQYEEREMVDIYFTYANH